MKAIHDKVYEELKESIRLHELCAPEATMKRDSDEEFKKKVEMRKEQDKHYKKWKFFKELDRRMK